MPTLSRGAALAAATVLAACSQDTSGPQSTPFLNADVATVVADNTGDDVDIMREPVFFVALPIGGPPAAPGRGDLHPNNCTFNAGSGRVECPPVNRGPFTITRSYGFRDGSGGVQPQYDAALTASANIQTAMTGEHSGGPWSATVARDRDMTVTGLLGEETTRTWNGTGNSAATRSRHSDDGAERSYDLSCTLAVLDVVVPVPHDDVRFPLSGTITHQCMITFSGGPRDGQTVERTATVTFNGSETATVTVGDREFDIDLRNRHRGPGRRRP